MTSFALLIALLPSIVSVIMAGVLAMRRIDGWGWFLLAAAVLAGAVQALGGGQ